MLRQSTFAAVVAGILTFVGTSGHRAEAETRNNDLFYNYYAGPPGVPAQLYISPRPTPPLVGHTWITYQPLMPHEFLYVHRRNYYKYSQGSNSYTEARIRWNNRIVPMMWSPF